MGPLSEGGTGFWEGGGDNFIKGGGGDNVGVDFEGEGGG